MKCQQFSSRLGVSQHWCAYYLIYEGRKEENESCKLFLSMLEVSSSDWAWHGGPWGSFFSCQAEISSLPLSVPSTVQKHCVFTGKMPKMFWKGSGGGLQTLQGSTGASLMQSRRGWVIQRCFSDTCHSPLLHPLPWRIKIDAFCSYCSESNLVNNKWWL